LLRSPNGHAKGRRCFNSGLNRCAWALMARFPLCFALVRITLIRAFWSTCPDCRWWWAKTRAHRARNPPQDPAQPALSSRRCQGGGGGTRRCPTEAPQFMFFSFTSNPQRLPKAAWSQRAKVAREWPLPQHPWCTRRRSRARLTPSSVSVVRR
jgi:hypothetical protein